MSPADIERAASAVRTNPEAHHEVAAPTVEYHQPLTPLGAMRGGDRFVPALIALAFLCLVVGLAVFG